MHRNPSIHDLTSMIATEGRILRLLIDVYIKTSTTVTLSRSRGLV